MPSATYISISALAIVAKSTLYETAGPQFDIDRRNKASAALFAKSANRNVIIPYKGKPAFRVETWWDSHSKTWITQLFKYEPDHVRSAKSYDDFQFGDSDYTGNKLDAAVAHVWAIARALRALNGESKSSNN